LSDPRILLCGPAIDSAESGARLEMLRQIELPNATKFVVTTGKFDGQKPARTFNVEANYPSQPARLLTLARWACCGAAPEPRFRDGYDLFCLDRILDESGGFDLAMLVRDATGLEQRWPELRSSIGDELFLTFRAASHGAAAAADAVNVLFNLTHPGSRRFFDHISGLYRDGAFYGIEDYSLGKALDLAFQSMRIEALLRHGAGEFDAGPDPEATRTRAAFPGQAPSSPAFVSV
jgi:hypothetical protein